MSTAPKYSEFVRPSTFCADFSRAMFGVPVSPLVDVVAPTLDRLPGDIQAQLKRDFWKRHDAKQDWPTKYAAQDWLAGEVQEFEREKIHRAFDEEEICALAKRWSELCGKMQRLEVMQDFARSVSVIPPEVKNNVTRIGAARRLSCVRWWRRQIRKHYTRRAEAHLRARGFVHKRRQVYASDRAVDVHRQRRARNKALLQDLQAVSDAGDQLELWEVVEKSQANPAIRRNELMTRLRGFDEVAQAADHAAEFFTLTCPSAYHASLASGSKNPLWQGYSPRDGQQWLCTMWARARAKLKRLGVSFYGFRVAEPHHDGTPHWHCVFFTARHHRDTLRTVLRETWLSQFRDERGADHVRCVVASIDRSKGSAVGYLAKYIAKNIDGHEVGDDYETENNANAKDTCARVAAWAAAHGIRQFQQIGGPSVVVWRELRRLRAELVTPGTEAIEAARKAADAGQWADFVAACGGISVARANSRVRAFTESTGELSQYDELRSPLIAGVQSARARVRTRSKVWRIQRKKGEPGRVATGESSGPISFPVSSVVNPRLINDGGRWVYEGGRSWFDSDAGRALLSSLGPVSITVRDSSRVPSGNVAGAHASHSARGSPRWLN
jgi:hypothetical protein